MNAVKEINRKTDREPDGQTLPRLDRQVEHQKE